MDLSVRFVSLNLVTEKIFIKFRDSINFHVFRVDECPMTPKTGFLGNFQKLGNNLSKFHFKII